MCDSVRGVTEGCDTDGDGTPDSSDTCDSVREITEDCDTDGVSDNVDQSMSEAGDAANNGCPLPLPEDTGSAEPQATEPV